MSENIKKPTTDKEYKTYQEKVCVNCANQFDLKRGIFTKGCMPLDMYAMVGGPDQMIKDDGTCLFFKPKGEGQ
jgi:hypothetical protein